MDGHPRVAVALGRRPEATPRDLLDALAERAGASGHGVGGRICPTLLAGRTPPASGAGGARGPEFDGVRARFEGEWVTLPDGRLDGSWRRGVVGDPHGRALGPVQVRTPTRTGSG